MNKTVSNDIRELHELNAPLFSSAAPFEGTLGPINQAFQWSLLGGMLVFVAFMASYFLIDCALAERKSGVVKTSVYGVFVSAIILMAAYAIGHDHASKANAEYVTFHSTGACESLLSAVASGQLPNMTALTQNRIIFVCGRANYEIAVNSAGTLNAQR